MATHCPPTSIFLSLKEDRAAPNSMAAPRDFSVCNQTARGSAFPDLALARTQIFFHYTSHREYLGSIWRDCLFFVPILCACDRESTCVFSDVPVFPSEMPGPLCNLDPCTPSVCSSPAGQFSPYVLSGGLSFHLGILLGNFLLLRHC